MQFLVDLWLPVLISGLAVFILSALVWTVMPHHKKEFAKLANEGAVLDALRAGNPAAGLYAAPHFADMKASETPEGKALMERGPIAHLTIFPGGAPAMGPMMGKSFVYNVVVASFIAYVAWHALPADASYLAVFRITGSVGFMAYALATVPESIWFGRPWSSFLLQAFDALLYSLVLAGVFGWLWYGR